MPIDYPLFSIQIKASDKGITELHFVKPEQEWLVKSDRNNPLIDQCAKELHDYFDGTLKTFQVPLDIQFGTPFEQEIWTTLQQIPYGTTWTYDDLATVTHRPKAWQAIGQANKKNPLPILIPCHRVIGKNGKLVGYMGNSDWGVAIKKELLTLEKQYLSSHDT